MRRSRKLRPGVPHRSIKDDVYRDWLIPKDSIVITNIWCVIDFSAAIYFENNPFVRHMLRDPEVYSDPSEFKPERFLSENGREPELDPRCAVFGFGRR